MTNIKPTIVIVPGAFHLKECMSHLISNLQILGFPVRTATLASTNNPDISVADDVALIHRELLAPLFQDDRRVIVLCHSYGGIPTSVAVQGQSKQERQDKGLSGGIIGLIYLCSFVPPVGGSLFNMIGGHWPSWQAPNSTGLVMVPEPVGPFYEDVDMALRSAAVGEVKGHSIKAIQDPALATGYDNTGYNGRRAYIRCTNDGAIPVVGQDAMVSGSKVEWKTITYETSHSPFLSEPKMLAATVRDLATEWASPA